MHRDKNAEVAYLIPKNCLCILADIFIYLSDAIYYPLKYFEGCIDPCFEPDSSCPMRTNLGGALPPYHSNNPPSCHWRVLIPKHLHWWLIGSHIVPPRLTNLNKLQQTISACLSDQQCVDADSFQTAAN